MVRPVHDLYASVEPARQLPDARAVHTVMMQLPPIAFDAPIRGLVDLARDVEAHVDERRRTRRRIEADRELHAQQQARFAAAGEAAIERKLERLRRGESLVEERVAPDDLDVQLQVLPRRRPMSASYVGYGYGGYASGPFFGGTMGYW